MYLMLVPFFSIFKWLLVFLKLFVTSTMNPNNHGNDEQCHRRQDDQTVIDITKVIECLRDNLNTKQGTRAEQFAEETYDNKDNRITKAITYTIEE